MCCEIIRAHTSADTPADKDRVMWLKAWVLGSPHHCSSTASLPPDSSFPSSALNVATITSRVGDKAVLPCRWKTVLENVPLQDFHIQWMIPGSLVFEQQGQQMWQAGDFEGRVEVPEQRLEDGDCSLIISDVQISDTGRYESFMVVNGPRSVKTRAFIQGVKLFVLDHKSFQSCGPGEDLVLDLHTPHSARLVFQSSNSSEWSDLWMRGDENGERLEKHPVKEQLTIRKVKSSDEGTYKVLDERGLAVSTVQLSVEGEKTTVFTTNYDVAKSSCSVFLTLAVLITSFLTSRLL
uniref:Galectin 17 n=1 Tax=Mastacembelus armatus TaxID=205130 RepID=A0A7N8WJ84_9TELE